MRTHFNILLNRHILNMKKLYFIEPPHFKHEEAVSWAIPKSQNSQRKFHLDRKNQLPRMRSNTPQV